MTIPCEQEENIKEVRHQVGAIGANIDRLCTSNERLAAEMREMNQTLVSHMISNREYDVRITAMEKSSDILFSRVRRLDDDYLPDLKERLKGIEGLFSYLREIPQKVELLEGWQNRMRGMLLIFPGICTAISTVAAVIAIYIALKV